MPRSMNSRNTLPGILVNDCWTSYRLKSSVYELLAEKLFLFIGTANGHSTLSLFHSGKVEGSHTCQGEVAVSPVNAESLAIGNSLFNASSNVHICKNTLYTHGCLILVLRIV